MTGDEVVAIGHGDAQAGGADGSEVGQVVADVGDFIVAQAQIAAQFFEGRAFIFTPLIDQLDAQLAGASQ